MRRNRSKMLALALVLAFAAGACFGGGGGDGAVDTGEFDKIRETDAKDVKAPEKTDTNKLALPGLILETNSRSWELLADAPEGKGVVVAFVQPNGPADNKGLARGDLVTAIDGTAVSNHEHALTLLRSERGEVRKLTVKDRNEKEREVEIKGDVPRERALPFLNALINGNENDPVYYFLRAQSSGVTKKTQKADLDKAIQMRPNFAEALAARGSLVFNLRLATKDKKLRLALIGEALANWHNALEIDPDNAEILALQANGQTAIGKVAQAKTDAEKAVEIDGSLPSANHALARANLALNKPQDAAGPAAAAVRGNPYTDLRYYRTLAEVFKDLKRKKDCTDTLIAPVDYLIATKVKELATEARQLRSESTKNCG